MGSVEHAIRTTFSVPITLHTLGQQKPFVLHDVGRDGVVLLLGRQEARTPLSSRFGGPSDSTRGLPPLGSTWPTPAPMLGVPGRVPNRVSWSIVARKASSWASS